MRKNIVITLPRIVDRETTPDALKEHHEQLTYLQHAIAELRSGTRNLLGDAALARGVEGIIVRWEEYAQASPKSKRKEWQERNQSVVLPQKT
jgi:hypothetical protein